MSHFQTLPATQGPWQAGSHVLTYTQPPSALRVPWPFFFSRKPCRNLCLVIVVHEVKGFHTSTPSVQLKHRTPHCQPTSLVSEHMAEIWFFCTEDRHRLHLRGLWVARDSESCDTWNMYDAQCFDSSLSGHRTLPTT